MKKIFLVLIVILVFNLGLNAQYVYKIKTKFTAQNIVFGEPYEVWYSLYDNTAGFPLFENKIFYATNYDQFSGTTIDPSVGYNPQEFDGIIKFNRPLKLRKMVKRSTSFSGCQIGGSENLLSINSCVNEVPFDPTTCSIILNHEVFEIFPIETIKPLNPSFSNLKSCETFNLITRNCNNKPFHYALEYQYGDNLINWDELLPYQLNPEIASINFTDIPGLSLGVSIRFRIRYIEEKTADQSAYSDILSYIFTDCSPSLTQDPPVSIPPICNNSDDGSVLVKFDRELAANERMLIYIENELLDGSWDWYHSAPILTSADINAGTDNTYTWNRILPPGRYRIRYVSKFDSTGDIPTNPNSDEQSQPFEIMAPDPVTFSYSKKDVLCKGDGNGVVTFTSVAGGSNNGFQYSIDNGANWQSTDTFSNLSPDNYYLLAKDSNNCISETSTTITITEPFEALSVSVAVIKDPSANGVSDGQISIDVFGGTGSVNYQWKKDGVDYATTQNITDLAAGIYYVTVTDSNGCTAALEINLQEPPPLKIVFTAQNIDCNGDTANITAQGQGGFIAAGEDYNYLWNDNSTNQTLLNVPAGTYTVTITDSNGVKFTDSFNLTEPDALDTEVNTTNVSCNGGSDGSIGLNISGGTSPYTINWADNIAITTADRTELSKGEYYYTITDYNNCSINGSVLITEPATLITTVENTQNPTIAGAKDGSIDITVIGGTPPFSYQWTDTNNMVIGTAEDISGLGDGTYILTVTDANFDLTNENAGCSTTISVQLQEPQPLAVSLSETKPVSCSGSSDGELKAIPKGGTQIPGTGYTYQWFKDNKGSFESLNHTSQIISGISAGKYRVIVTDNIGSQTQTEYTLKEPSPLGITFTKQDINCYGGSDGSIDITVSGGTIPYSYSWKDHSASEISNSEDLNDLISGKYTILISDARGCIVEETIELFSPIDELMITLDQLKDPSAYGISDGAIDISVSGGSPPYTFEWTDESGTILSDKEDLDNVGEGIYTLTVKDGNADKTNDNNGCITSEDFVLLEPDPIVITISETTSLLCNGNDNAVLTASVTGGYLNSSSNYIYTWFKDVNGTFMEIDKNTAVATELNAGIYQVNVTDDNMISQTATYTLTEPESLDILLTITNTVSCDDGADGSISSLVSGGNPPYVYQWNNGDTTTDISNLTVGIYTLTITDSNHCILSENIELKQPDGLTLESTVTPPLCFGGNDGKINVLVSGGIPNYNYLWNTGATTSFIDNLSAGDYHVIITDGKGCKIIQNFTVVNPEPLNLDLGEDKVLCLGQSYDLDVSIDDHGAVYQWTSDNGFKGTSPIVSLDTDGVYTLTIMNSNGCVATNTLRISTSDEIISTEFLVSTQAFVGEAIVVVDVSEPVPDSVSWIFSDGTTVVSQNGDYAELIYDQEGVYAITMIAKKGECQDVLTKEIFVQRRTFSELDQDENTSFIKEFKVYPNPNTGNFKAEVKLRQEAPVSIKMINLNSNVVSKTRTGKGKESYIFNYDINIATGVYLILLETPKGTQIRKIIVG